MPIGDRLIHSLAIVTPTTDTSDDAYGQPVPGEPTIVLASGLIQPKRAREESQANQAGAMVADHTIYLQPQTLSPAAYIRYEPDDGDRYQITGIRPYNMGRDPHLEVDCRRIVSTLPEAEAS